eukprot:TRINITY_DN1027_c0_g1_i1.p1 TRINITY_DN1027_c0_g1~~TRINITY_DN1027_c0_g1_i1.p1  ORF type:complete len:803 (+),score=281.20 TRINITY_DN1027_c0_g1_i1:83-2491(+)
MKNEQRFRQRLAKKSMSRAMGGKVGIIGAVTLMALINIAMKRGAAPWQSGSSLRRLGSEFLGMTGSGNEAAKEATAPETKEEKTIEEEIKEDKEEIKEDKAKVAEEEKVTEEEANTGIAIMLSGSLTFMMGIFYIVNDKDEDIRRYSWQVISATISIFSAVLLFQAINGIVDHVSKEVLGLGEYGCLFVGFAQLLVWFASMQFILAAISGAISLVGVPQRDRKKLNKYSETVKEMAAEARRDVAQLMKEEDGMNMSGEMLEFVEAELKTQNFKNYEGPNDIFIKPNLDIGIGLLDKVKDSISSADQNGTPAPTAEYFHDDAKSFLLDLFVQRAEYMEEMEANMKCWAVLFGHITGFAAIHAFGELQQLIGKHNPLFALALTAPAYLAMSGLFLAMDELREYVNKGDGYEDERETCWDETTEETENDIIALMMSFLWVQCIRQLITGALPNAEGAEEEAQMRGHSIIEAVLLIGTGCAVISAMAYKIIHSLAHEEEEEKKEGEHHHPSLRERFTERLSEHFSLTCAMIFAWTLYFGTQWGMCSLLYGQVSEMMLEVLTTLANSLMAFSVIYSLDKLADREDTDATADLVIGRIIAALAVLIGFAWEHCFDKATEVLTDMLPFKPVEYPRFLLVCIIFLIVVPAWRWYIVPFCITLDKEAEEKEEEQKKEAAMTKKAEKEAKEQLKKWGEQGVKADKDRGMLKEALLKKYKEEEEKGEQEEDKKKSVVTPKAKLMDEDKDDLIFKVHEMQRKVLTYQTESERYLHGHRVQLERRNAELEGVIQKFQHETEDLQKLANRLTQTHS